MNSKRLKKANYAAAVGVLALVLATVFAGCTARRVDDSGLGMEVPEKELFLNAESADTCEDFDITLLYDDTAPPEFVEGLGDFQKIRWYLYILPKEGVEATDFYCTLFLNEWIVNQSSSRTLKYIGMPKGFVGDIPSESKGINALSEKFIPVKVKEDYRYDAAAREPAAIMVAYNGQERFYFVTPELGKIDEKILTGEIRPTARP